MTLIYVIITAIVFTTLEPVSKLIANEVNPFGITFWRCMIGALILMPFAFAKVKKQNIKIDRKDIGMSCLLGSLLICVSLVVLQFGVKIADSPSFIAIVFSSNSVLTILFAMLLLKEKMTRRKLIAVILCAAGVLVCADFSSGSNLLSIACAIIAALSLSLYTVLSKKYMKKYGGVIHTALSFFFGSVILLIGLLFAGVDVIPSLNVSNVSLLLYLGIIVTGVGYWGYNMAIEKGGAMMASLAFFIKPILTPFATFLINDIVPGVKVFVALALIVCGSYFATYKKDKETSIASNGGFSEQHTYRKGRYVK